MTLFRLDASIRVEDSVSREVADAVQQGWLAERPGAEVTRRDLGAAPVPADAWPRAVAGSRTAADDRSADQRGALGLAAQLADEVSAATALLVAAPLYNFGVPQHLKSWIDLLIVDPRFAPGTQPLLGRPVALVVARGGGYGAGTPREGWDHATPYLSRIFGEVWGGEVTVVAAELTLADSVPAMAELRPLAAQSRAQARTDAERAGREFARRTVTAAA